MKNKDFVDVLNKTPKENELLILDNANKVLLTDKTIVLWFIYLIQLTKFGFMQFLPVSAYFVLEITAVLFAIFIIVLLFFVAPSPYSLADRYVNRDQYEQLKTLAKQKKIVGKYLFLVRVSGRQVYLAEYKELIRMKDLCFIY